MKISYFGLQSDIVKIISDLSSKEDTLFVFYNYHSMNDINAILKKDMNNLFPKYQFMSDTDFYEHLLMTDKILLKEEKEVILFYESLDKEIKEKLDIKSYFDVIDIAYNYYSLFSELQEYKVNLDKITFEAWQLDTVSVMKKINKNFIKECEKRRFAVRYMIRDINNIDYNFIDKYKKIIFINKLKFTPFEKELLEIVGNQIDVELYLQLEDGDFSSENLKLKQITLPKNEKELSTEIIVKESPNKFVQLLDLINDFNSENKYIFDVEDINFDDYQLLNQSRLSYSVNLSLNKTKIYTVIELISNILRDASYNKTLEKEIKSEIVFTMNTLIEALKNEDFKKVFFTDNKDRIGVYNVFQLFARENYKYLSANEVKNKLNYIINNLKNKNKLTDEQLSIEQTKYEKLIEFLDQMEELLNIKTFKEYTDFLEKLSSYNFGEKYFIKDKYLEALSEIVTIEEFNFDGLWNSFFENISISGNLLKLFLKYLDKKDFNLMLEKDENEESSKSYRINNIDNMSELNKESLYLLNLQGNLPKVKVNNFLFTKTQRIELGLPTKEDEKKVNAFIFYKNIFSSKKVVLSYIKNLDDKIESSGLLSEIILKYNLKVKESNLSEDIVLSIVKDYFKKSKNINSIVKYNKFQKSDLLKPEEMNEISLGYYQYETLEKCQYKYFLDKYLQNEYIEEITTVFDLNSFGTVIHKIFEEIMIEKKDDIEIRNDFSISEDKIRDVFNRILNQSIYIIPKDYLEFYRKVSFESIVTAVDKFFKLLNSEISNLSNIQIVSEEHIKQKKEAIIDSRVTINGVMDLHIKSNEKEIYVDYKSGNLSKDDKKINALKQLDYYELISYIGKNANIDKWVIDAWSGRNVVKDYVRKNPEDIITAENVKNTIDSYFREKKYLLSSKLSDCKYCKYIGICRRGEEIE